VSAADQLSVISPPCRLASWPPVRETLAANDSRRYLERTDTGFSVTM
jgi:hypothetical protein